MFLLFTCFQIEINTVSVMKMVVASIIHLISQGFFQQSIRMAHTVNDTFSATNSICSSLCNENHLRGCVADDSLIVVLGNVPCHNTVLICGAYWRWMSGVAAPVIVGTYCLLFRLTILQWASMPMATNLCWNKGLALSVLDHPFLLGIFYG